MDWLSGSLCERGGVENHGGNDGVVADVTAEEGEEKGGLFAERPAHDWH